MTRLDPPRPDEIHLWICSGVTGERSDEAAALLSRDEQNRAAAFRFVRDRRRFVGARALLRVVLGVYHGCTPAALRFSRGEWGKPSLAEPASATALPFSLSRSHDAALLAVSGGGEVGADVEFRRSDRPDVTLVRRQFCEAEQRFITDAADATRAFYEIWARKEAYIKALGRGLSHPLRSFDVTPQAGRAVKVVEDWSEARPSDAWHVRTIVLPVPGYAAAVATQEVEPRLELCHITVEKLVEKSR